MREGNGPRPSPLKISNSSHLLQKHPHRREPVIIYAHSPKIIHTQPRDFMALVQKLTGLSPSQRPQHLSSSSQNHNNSTSVHLTDENVDEVGRNSFGSGAGEVIQGTSTHPSPCEPAKLNNQGSHYLRDIPLLTPTSTDFFCSPMHVLRRPASSFNSPTLTTSTSPSFVEFLKGLPEF